MFLMEIFRFNCPCGFSENVPWILLQQDFDRIASVEELILRCRINTEASGPRDRGLLAWTLETAVRVPGVVVGGTRRDKR